MKKKSLSRVFWVFSLIAVSSFWTSAFAQRMSPIEKLKRLPETKRQLAPAAPETNTPQTLPFSQNWTNVGLITVSDDWSGVPGIQGFRGDDLTLATGTDPRTLLADGSATPIDVNANIANCDTSTTGGIAECEAAGGNPVVALQGSGTADAPHLVIYLNTTGLTNIQFATNVRDVDGSADNAIQQVDVQYRVGGTGNYTSVTGGYIADATTGPSLATMVTPLNLSLPADANNQALVEVRVMTTNAVGNDEHVGIDDISVTGTGGTPAIKRLFNARQNGAAEVPPVATTALGFGRVVLNEAETQITASVYYNNLSSGTTLGHIHGPAAVGAIAPPIFDMTPTVGQTTGSAVDRVFAVTPAQVADLRAGLWYFNVHTTNFGGGEIRGQIFPAKAGLDFDNDALTDYVVVRDSNGVAPGGFIQWHVNSNASPGVFSQTEWGLIDATGPDTSDILTPADFDGDGKTDLAVYRESTLNFYIIESATSTIRIDNFGLAGDEPEIVGDYSGDGRADLAVYRKGTPSVFFYRPSGTFDLVVVDWGDQTYSDAPGDWDGDGIYDFGLVKTESGHYRFLIKLSGGGQIDTTFGFDTDVFLPGDYDGDGRIDICVARQDGLFWRWEWDLSSTPALDTQLDFWGLFATDLPVQGDYNGDGKTDYAVWRPGAQSTFYVMTPLTRQIITRDWGVAGDFPPANDTVE